MSGKFNEVSGVFDVKLRNILYSIPENIKSETFEIRVRIGKPVVLIGSYGVAFVDENSCVSHMRCSDALVINSDDFRNIVSEICGYSVYSHQSEMLNGFVTFGNGHRAGFCGTAVMQNNELLSVNNLDSVNIRIAREFDDSGRKIADLLYRKIIPKGLIIAGKPCSGKTTILKSLAKLLSSEYVYGFKKCTVIDERFELGSIEAVNCDFLKGYKKDTAIVHAIRTLSPQIIICDEISTEEEVDRIIAGADSGVSFIVSVHASDINELVNRNVSSLLIDSGAFDYAVILGDSEQPGTISEIIRTEELSVENYCSHVDFRKLNDADIYDYKTRK